MSEREPTPAELLSIACTVAFQGRRIIEDVNHSLPAEMLSALQSLHESLATVGGAMMALADQLDVSDEVEYSAAFGEYLRQRGSGRDDEA